MPLNKLETVIISASKRAAERYAQMSGSPWLSHGPEHFLQNEVARAIWKNGDWVFIDASGDLVRAELGKARGRRPNARRKRFDITVFYKPGDRVRAVIEVKTRATFSATAIAKDAAKIEGDFKNTHHARSGYLLVYGEADGSNRRANLTKRFVTTFPNRLGSGWRRVSWFVGADDDHEERAWAIGLYRFS